MVISPATSTSPVVSRVSHATRLSGSSASRASRTESEIWSAILSGWPSVTDSEVKVYRVLTGGSILIGGVRPGVEQTGSAGVGLPDATGTPPATTLAVTVAPTARTPYPRWRRPPHPWCAGAPSVTEPSAPKMVTSLVSWSNPTPGADTSLATIRSTPLAASLAVRPLGHLLGLRREPDQHLARPPAPAQLGEDVRRRLEDQVGHAVGLVQLGLGGHLGAEVGHRGGHDHHVGRRRPWPAWPPPSPPPSPPVDDHPGGDRLARWWSPAPPRAPPTGGGVGQGVALLPRRAVGDEPHRIDRLAGAPGRDHHPHAGQVAAAVPVAGGPAAPSSPSTVSTITDGSASRPAPMSPPASRPSSGGTTVTPRARRTARLCWTAGCSHISVCMAGHTTTGAAVATRVAVRRSSAKPPA